MAQAKVTVAFRLNGRSVAFDPVSPTAVELIRDQAGLTGTKLVCGTGSCGACVVQVNGVPLASCLLPVEDLDGEEVVTVEGLADAGPHPIQRALAACDGLQCGFCTPGFVVEAAVFCDRWRSAHPPGSAPTIDDINRALAGHLCRCGAYPGIREAVITVWASTQAVSFLRQELADRYELDPSQVEVRAEFVGGAFGAKQGVGEETIAAVELSVHRQAGSGRIRSPGGDGGGRLPAGCPGRGGSRWELGGFPSADRHDLVRRWWRLGGPGHSALSSHPLRGLSPSVA